MSPFFLLKIIFQRISNLRMILNYAKYNVFIQHFYSEQIIFLFLDSELN
jgi:hypothetical protein